jgi:hypothetical protein
MKTQTGQENGKTTLDQWIYYSFTLPSAQSGQKWLASHFEPVCAEGITGSRPLKVAEMPPPTVNAFLTLSAVTKW